MEYGKTKGSNKKGVSSFGFNFYWPPFYKMEKDPVLIKQRKDKEKIWNYLIKNRTISPVVSRAMTEEIYDSLTKTVLNNNCIELYAHKITNI